MHERTKAFPSSKRLPRLLETARHDVHVYVKRAIGRWGEDIASIPLQALLQGTVTSDITEVMTIGTDDGARCAYAVPVPTITELCASSVIADDLPVEAIEQLTRYALNSRAKGTFAQWRTCWNLVLAYCGRFDQCPFPMSEATAMRIATGMAEAGYSLGYIRNVRGTISVAHDFKDALNPTRGKRFRTVFEGIARTLGSNNPNAKDALCCDELRAIGELLQQTDDNKAVQKWAILCVAYYGSCAGRISPIS